MIEVSGVFFILFFIGIRRVSDVSLDKLSSNPDKLKTLKFPLRFFLGFLYSGTFIRII